MTSNKRHLRKHPKIHYKDDTRTDHWRDLGTFKHSTIQKITQNSDYGCIVAQSCSFPYYCQSDCWIRFYDQEQFYFEKQMKEIHTTPMFTPYTKWILSKFRKLLPYYRAQIEQTIANLTYKYHVGDIVALKVSQNDLKYAQINEIYAMGVNIWYNINYIDIRSDWPCNDDDESHGCWRIEDEIKRLVVPAIERFMCNEDTTQIRIKIIEWERDLFEARYNTATKICYDEMENDLVVLCDDWIAKGLKKHAVNQLRKAHTPLRKCMFNQMMQPYLESEYGISHWTTQKDKTSKSLSLSKAAELFGKEAVIQKQSATHELFIAEPHLVHQDDILYFEAHICSWDQETAMIKGDPARKRLRGKRSKKKDTNRTHTIDPSLSNCGVVSIMETAFFQSKLPRIARQLIRRFLMK
eukprot:919443_1